jgi:hypothetical protein
MDDSFGICKDGRQMELAQDHVHWVVFDIIDAKPYGFWYKFILL